MTVRKFSGIVALCIFQMIFSCFIAWAGPDHTKKVKDLFGVLQEYHYNKLDLDEDVFNDIKISFLKNLDPEALYFTGQDIAAFEACKFDPSNGMAKGLIAFFKKAAGCYETRLKEAYSIASGLLKAPMNYSEKENFVFPKNDAADYAADAKELAVRWKELLKYEILSYLYNKTLDDPALKDDFKKIMRFEPSARSAVKNRRLNHIRNVLKYPGGIDAYAFPMLLRSIANRYDPHTEYFSTGDKKDFETSLSSGEYSFGFYLKKNNKGEYVVNRLVPGGPAWKSARINKGDRVIKIKFSGSTPPVELFELSEYDVDALINSGKTKAVTLYLRRKSGLLSIVRLEKEKIEDDYGKIKSFVLNGKKKIGYIYLPDFYTDWENGNSSECANDLAAEIIKLKREKIDGIILDLRNNGGGSVKEAMDIAGIFIDEGPLCIEAGRDKTPRIIKDANRGLIYDGHLILMVNRLSASASEMLAQVMKDYGRALIVGSPTFGKASGQVIFPITASDGGKQKIDSDDKKSEDFVKLTVYRYYGLTGQTHQLKGVMPDVLLPDYTKYLALGEKSLPVAHPSDRVVKNFVYRKSGDIYTKMLAVKSHARVSADEKFRDIVSLNEDLKKYLAADFPYPLDINEFFKSMNERGRVFDDMDNSMSRKSVSFRAGNTSFENEIIEVDSYEKAVNDDLLKAIDEDIYIDEAYKIMCDYINQ